MGRMKKASKILVSMSALRAEAAFTNSILKTIDSNVRNNYFQLYPTIHLAYKRKKGEWQLNYSRRVNRPGP
jgi:hypothetical protein